jgi:hypothetical protein
MQKMMITMECAAAAGRHTAELRAERRLPPLWSLPGHIPAQAAKCPGVGKRLTSVS